MARTCSRKADSEGRKAPRPGGSARAARPGCGCVAMLSLGSVRLADRSCGPKLLCSATTGVGMMHEPCLWEQQRLSSCAKTLLLCMRSQ
jgi:hypothetical protein